MWNMIFNEIQKNFNSLMDNFILKIIGSGVVIMLVYHSMLCALFSIVVCLDLYTRWIALTKKYLDSEGKESSLLDCVKNMNVARKAGYINSYMMRKHFVSKMLTYFIAVFGAFIVDTILVKIGTKPMMVTTALGYLATTEMLSVVENLDEAGVAMVHDLVEVLKGKRKI
jgi:phage-related holin